MAVKDRKRELVDAAIAHMEQHGVGDLSLRGLAAALGTSHRMLIHHFGSKEGLWVAIVREVEARQREILGEIIPQQTKPAGEALREWWRHLSDPALWPNERLFFELYGRALQDEALASEFLQGIVEDWLVPGTEINIAYGLPPQLARAHARLGIAVVRGLLLDLLATGDEAGVNDAMEAFIDVYEAWLERAARSASGASQNAQPGSGASPRSPSRRRSA